MTRPLPHLRVVPAVASSAPPADRVSSAPGERVSSAPLERVSAAPAERLSSFDSGQSAPLPLERAFRLYSPYVAAVALRLLGRDAEVDDVVQDVFLAGHKGLAALREPDAIKGWLATVTVRIARRRLWARRVYAFVGLDDAPNYADVASPDASPEQRALVSAVYAVLDKLPVEQRLAWALRHLDGEELTDVARACSCSLATVKRRIGAAHQAIERALDHG